MHAEGRVNTVGDKFTDVELKIVSLKSNMWRHLQVSININQIGEGIVDIGCVLDHSYSYLDHITLVWVIG